MGWHRPPNTAVIATTKLGSDRRLVASRLALRARDDALHWRRIDTLNPTMYEEQHKKRFRHGGIFTHIPSNTASSAEACVLWGVFFCSTYGTAIQQQIWRFFLTCFGSRYLAGFFLALFRTHYYYAARHDICTIRYRQI